MKKLLLLVLFGISLPVLATECPPDKPLITPKGCQPCDLLDGVLSIKQENICPDREIIEGIVDKSPGRWVSIAPVSILKKCPAEAPLRTFEGCIPCDNKEHQVPTLSDCSSCPNLSGRTDGERDTKCFPACPEEQILARTGKEVSWKCVSCTDGYTKGITESDCKKCPNRLWNEEEQSCLFKESPCSKNNPFVKMESGIAEKWECISCENSFIKGFSKEECQKCPDYRFWDEEKGICDFKKSPYPDRPIVIPIRYDGDGCNGNKEAYTFSSCDKEDYNVPKDRCPPGYNLPGYEYNYGYVEECQKNLCIPKYEKVFCFVWA